LDTPTTILVTKDVERLLAHTCSITSDDSRMVLYYVGTFEEHITWSLQKSTVPNTLSRALYNKITTPVKEAIDLQRYMAKNGCCSKLREPTGRLKGKKESFPCCLL
jgi:hypothetical protein